MRVHACHGEPVVVDAAPLVARREVGGKALVHRRVGGVEAVAEVERQLQLELLPFVGVAPGEELRHRLPGGEKRRPGFKPGRRCHATGVSMRSE